MILYIGIGKVCLQVNILDRLETNQCILVSKLGKYPAHLAVFFRIHLSCISKFHLDVDMLILTESVTIDTICFCKIIKVTEYIK